MHKDILHNCIAKFIVMQRKSSIFEGHRPKTVAGSVQALTVIRVQSHATGSLRVFYKHFRSVHAYLAFSTGSTLQIFFKNNSFGQLHG